MRLVQLGRDSNVDLLQTPPSRNLTVTDSPGLTEPRDPAYAAIPLDSRQPPAPIDPSSEFDACMWSVNSNDILVSKWFYISSVQV